MLKSPVAKCDIQTDVRQIDSSVAIEDVLRIGTAPKADQVNGVYEFVLAVLLVPLWSRSSHLRDFV